MMFAYINIRSAAFSWIGRVVVAICFLPVDAVAQLASNDCIDQGGEAFCSRMSPNKWAYSACYDFASTKGHSKDMCEARGGTWSVQTNGDTYCLGAAQFSEGNIVGISKVAMSSIFGAVSLNSDTGWGASVASTECYAGSPVRVGGVLTQDFRKLVFKNSGGTYGMILTRGRNLFCPPGTIQRNAESSPVCEHQPNVCSDGVGNPINPENGKKTQVEHDVVLPWLDLYRIYNSFFEFYPVGYVSAPASFTPQWRASFDFSLAKNKSGVRYQILPSGAAQYFDDHGYPLHPTENFVMAQNLSDGRQAVRNGLRMMVYGASGDLDSIFESTGGRLSFYRAAPGDAKKAVDVDGLVAAAPVAARSMGSIWNNFGRGLLFNTLASGQIHSVDLDGVGRLAAYKYDSIDRLVQVLYPVGAVEYVYGDLDRTSQVQNNFALTSIYRGQGSQPYASFTYAASGRAIGTEHADGVDRFKVHYAQLNKVSEITMPNNDLLVKRFQRLKGVIIPVEGSQPAGAGCAASSSKIEYDANGNKALEDDFNGNRTCFVSTGTNEGGSASVPNLLKVKVEGLVGTTGASASLTPTTCSKATADGAELSRDFPGSRKTSTQWHPQWALKIKEAQPNLITTWVYNGQPDPFNGGATARCVTAQYGSSNNQPKLPDGSDTAVLCKKVEQATTDATGEKGFAATLTTLGDVKQRQWEYRYNQYGQVLSSTDPMGQSTTYTYRCEGQSTCDGTNKFVFTGTAPNEVGYYQGDLWKVTNAAGHVTEYVSYDRAGRVLEMKDANGLQTKLSYSPRGWVTEVNTAGLKTSYEYWPTGLLKKSTQPDGSYLYYRYDDAHRLTSVTDQVNSDGNPTGNTVTYTLDNMGNRKTEQLNDATNVITRHIQRDFDALNRLQSITGGVQ